MTSTDPLQLSGGQKQRVAIARALVNRPDGRCSPTSPPATWTALPPPRCCGSSTASARRARPSWWSRTTSGQRPRPTGWSRCATARSSRTSPFPRARPAPSRSSPAVDRIESRSVSSLRLAARDLHRRSTETLLLFVALAVASATLTIALVLHGQTGRALYPHAQRTSGPDVVAVSSSRPWPDRHRLRPGSAPCDRGAPQVSASSPPFPTTWTSITARWRHRCRRGPGARRPRLVRRQPTGRERSMDRRPTASSSRGPSRPLSASESATGRRRRPPVPVVGIAVSAALAAVPPALHDRLHPRPVELVLRRSPASSGLPASRPPPLATRTEPLVWFQYLTLHHPTQRPRSRPLTSPAALPTAAPSCSRGRRSRPPGRAARFRAGRRRLRQHPPHRPGARHADRAHRGRISDEVRRVGHPQGRRRHTGVRDQPPARALPRRRARVRLSSGSWPAASLTPRLVTLQRRTSSDMPAHDLLGRPTRPSCLAPSSHSCSISCAIPAWRAARTSTVHALADSDAPPVAHRPPPGPLRATARLLPCWGFGSPARRPRRALLTYPRRRRRRVRRSAHGGE